MVLLVVLLACDKTFKGLRLGGPTMPARPTEFAATTTRAWVASAGEPRTEIIVSHASPLSFHAPHSLIFSTRTHLFIN
jgi:hypothetical protein